MRRALSLPLSALQAALVGPRALPALRAFAGAAEPGKPAAESWFLDSTLSPRQLHDELFKRWETGPTPSASPT